MSESLSADMVVIGSGIVGSLAARRLALHGASVLILDGLAIFGIFTRGDGATAKFKFYYEGGCAYRGLIPGRGLDLLSVGWVRTDINPRLQMREAATGTAILTNEQLVEFNYTAQVASWLQIRPGVQYDVRPGAASTHPNTWVYGIQIKATL